MTRSNQVSRTNEAHLTSLNPQSTEKIHHLPRNLCLVCCLWRNGGKLFTEYAAKECFQRFTRSFFLFIVCGRGSLRTRLANRIFIFTEENGLNKKGAFLPLRNSLQNFPCPSMVLLLQIGPKCELGPCHTFFTSPDICSRIRSKPSAFSLSSVR